MDDEHRQLEQAAREAYGRTLAATLAAALVVSDMPLPEGERGRRLLARAKAISVGRGGSGAATACPGPETAGSVRLVARLIGQMIEVVTLGTCVPTAATRGAARGGMLVRESVGGREIRVHFDVIEERLLVTLDLGTDAASRATRATLMRGGRELASEVLQQGRWRLPELAAGTWTVRVCDADGWSAVLDLALEDLERSDPEGGCT